MTNLERRMMGSSATGLPTVHQQRDSKSSDTSCDDDASPIVSPSHGWDSPIRNHRDKGLHQRHVGRRSPDHSPLSRQETFSKGLKRRRKRYPCVRWLRSCILAGIPAYLLLLFLFLKRLNQQNSLLQHETTIISNGESAAYFRSLHSSLHEALQWRLRNDNDHWEKVADILRINNASFGKRRTKVRPRHWNGHKFDSFVYAGVDVAERPKSTYEPNEPLRNVMVQGAKEGELCGLFAHASAAERPGDFIYRDALQMPKSRVTRVLITGILSQVAYALALSLKERCNVQVVIGFDSMFPNSLSNRLRLQEQMAVLTKSIPKLVRPIFLSYIGIDPAKHPKNFKVLESTKEVDIIKTLTPTHIVHLGSSESNTLDNFDQEFRNSHSPYPREGHNPSLYASHSGTISMEQILAAMADAPEKDRPHLVYAGTTLHSESSLHGRRRLQDEVLADFFYQEHGVFSVGVRLPDGVYGPWGSPNSRMYQLFESLANKTATPHMGKMDLIHVEDVVDGITAAMQFRRAKPVIFNLNGDIVALEGVADNVLSAGIQGKPLGEIATEKRGGFVSNAIGWRPTIPLEQGVIRTLAWHIDRMRPFGYPRNSTGAVETGDMVLKRNSVPTCSAKDLVCHLGRPFLPCASECSVHDQCVATMFDSLISNVQDLTEECDIVLYTQDFDINTESLALQSEYVEEGSPQICNLAFVNSRSKLVDGSIAKVPESELEKLGVQITDGDNIEAQKREKLNGRLLYRGWILVWVEATDTISAMEKFFLKLSPGKLFHSDVEAAVFIDQGFGVSPKADDILFLVHEMHRQATSSRVIKRKTRPKVKVLLPAEPERQAVVLMSELKYQDSSAAERLAPSERISVYEATRFMRFSNGEDPLGREPSDIKLQREFYDRLRASINPEQGRSPDAPAHRFELRRWSRSRWVAHDMKYEESRQLRCEWYQEHSLWETPLDQLTFAYVMEKLELRRKVENKELDDSVQKQLAEKTEMKKLLSDTFEWSPVNTEQNKLYSPYEEMRVLPYEMDYAEVETEANSFGDKPLLFVRVISDRIMAYARKAWNSGIKHAHVSDAAGEL